LYSEFLSLPVQERIRQMRAGEYAVMCAGFRDMWLALAAGSPELGIVRHVGAYNFSPPLGDLVPLSHALAELWVASEQRWVLIDPWFGFMLRRNGRFLGVSDLLATEANHPDATLELVALVSRVRRFMLQKIGDHTSREELSSPVREIAPGLTPKLLDSGYQPGYLQYFRAIEYGAAIGGKSGPDADGVIASRDMGQTSK
jgi:hypothetical protein